MKKNDVASDWTKHKWFDIKKNTKWKKYKYTVSI